ncbi:MAG TPA: glycoside hydrolase family 43 protein [Candidatus Sulfotelmatobacter sp.]|nr:glycoside hydrolase family 43 protein [Candidatus Sulfotelmatobacter sp.]
MSFDLKTYRRGAASLLAAGFVALQTFCIAAPAAKHSEFKPGEVWTDTSGAPINAHGGGVLYCGKKYYWYGEIKTGKTWTPECNRSWGGTRVELVGVSCYSSKDLYNWQNEGNVLPAVQDDVQHALHKSKVLERPKVLFNRATKKFVMWMHVDSEDYRLARAGVAVSDSPTGPFTYVGSFRPDNSMSRDMTVFQDEDGKAYLFYASEDNATMHIALLTEDYLKPSGRFERIFVGRSMEAPAVFKHAGRYYVVASGCTGWAPNPARSAVANSIWGPWEELSNPCRGPEAEITFRGQSTYVLPVAGKPGTYIFLADRWNSKDLQDSRYLWLPLQFTDKGFEVPWHASWSLKSRK